MNGLRGAPLYCILSPLWLSSGSAFLNSQTDGQYLQFPILLWSHIWTGSTFPNSQIKWQLYNYQLGQLIWKDQRTMLLIFSGSKFEIKLEVEIWYHFQFTSHQCKVETVPLWCFQKFLKMQVDFFTNLHYWFSFRD